MCVGAVINMIKEIKFSVLYLKFIFALDTFPVDRYGMRNIIKERILSTVHKLSAIAH